MTTQGITRCERTQEQVRRGSYALKAHTDLDGNHANRANGEVVTDLHDVASVPERFAVDLDGRTLTASVFVPPGNEGERDHPNYLQLFVKDDSPGAVGQYGDAFNIPDAGGWLEIGLQVHDFDGAGGFDPTRIRFVGVKVGIGGESHAKLTAPIYVDVIESSHPLIDFGFEQPSRAAIDLERLADAGVEVVRWFVFGDGRASPDFDAESRVTGLDDRVFADFDEMIALAGLYDLRLVPVFFDYLVCAEPDRVNDAPVFGHAELIRDPQKTALFTRAVAVQRIPLHLGRPDHRVRYSRRKLRGERAPVRRGVVPQRLPTRADRSTVRTYRAARPRRPVKRVSGASCAACATRSTARTKASSFAFDGFVNLLVRSPSTACSERESPSSSCS